MWSARGPIAAQAETEARQVNCGGILAWVCAWTRSSAPAPQPTGAAAAAAPRRDPAAVHTWPKRASVAPAAAHQRTNTDAFFYWEQGLRFDMLDCGEVAAACAAGASGQGTLRVGGER